VSPTPAAAPASTGGAGAGRGRPGRQRSEAADQAILTATVDVLAEEGYAGFTVAAVIARAGVSSATLYRRWATKQELIAAALASLGPEPVSIDTGSLEGDVDAFVRYMADAMTVRRTDLAGVLTGQLRHDSELRAALEAKFVVPRRELLRTILRRAEERGELSSLPPLEVCWSLVSGPLHHRAYVRVEPFTPAFVRSVTTFIVAGLRGFASA
jgi:AcrR family transcriptional regulator